jgi:hypothetical protein
MPAGVEDARETAWACEFGDPILTELLGVDWLGLAGIVRHNSELIEHHLIGIEFIE